MSTYQPKEGTKVALAATALRNGPMTSTQLAPALNCEAKSVNALLFVALEHGYFVKVKDAGGVVHFALGGTVIDERFTPIGDGGSGKSRNARGRVLLDAPLVRSVSSAIAPTDEAISFANPFGKKPVTETPSVHSDQPSGGHLQPDNQASGASGPASTDSFDGQTTPAPAEEAEEEPAFECALWSDGDMQFVRDGETVVVLSPAEVKKVRSYFERIAA